MLFLIWKQDFQSLGLSYLRASSAHFSLAVCLMTCLIKNVSSNFIECSLGQSFRIHNGILKIYFKMIKKPVRKLKSWWFILGRVQILAASSVGSRCCSWVNQMRALISSHDCKSMYNFLAVSHWEKSPGQLVNCKHDECDFKITDSSM